MAQRMAVPLPADAETWDAVRRDNARTAEAIRKDAEDSRRSDESFKSHRGLRDGRNFMWDCFRHREFSALRENYDSTFKGCVGSKDWFDKNFCPVCDKRRTACSCN